LIKIRAKKVWGGIAASRPGGACRLTCKKCANPFLSMRKDREKERALQAVRQRKGERERL